MINYLGEVCGSMLGTIGITCAILALGYLLGAIEIKGISLGSAGVLVVALAYGVFTTFVPSFAIGATEITLFSEGVKSQFNTISGIGTAMFVTSVGLIAGPKFFRSFNKKTMAYLVMGVVIITIAAVVGIGIVKIFGEDPALVVGIMTGALTSTPGLAAAKEVAVGDAADAAIAGYGIAYLYGVLGVVLFVQIIPKLLKVDIAKERESFTAANAVAVKSITRKLKDVDPFGFFPFFLAVALGYVIGSIKIPGINFSLGASGGTLVAGLIIGHFGHIGPINCTIDKGTLKFFRELGLVLFLAGAGVPGGVNFVANVKVSYFIYGIVLTTVPMIVGFLLAKYVFKLSVFNNLGSITGGMTSTPALGALISTAGTDDVSSAYAATYPLALVSVVLAAKLIIMFC